jgi:hypothetical protein
MFNHIDYEKRLDAMKERVRNDGAGEWRPTVSRRYAEFLLGNVRNRLHALKGAVDLPSYYVNDVRDLAGILYNAAMLMSGQVSVTDAVKAEAEMRLFAEANTASPPEDDASLRKRVIQWLVDHNLSATIDIETAIGKSLDGIASGYGLKRIGT